jgi:hypothetical protein
MGMMMPETCWAIFKRQAIKLRDWCIWLVDLFECWNYLYILSASGATIENSAIFHTDSLETCPLCQYVLLFPNQKKNTGCRKTTQDYFSKNFFILLSKY